MRKAVSFISAIICMAGSAIAADLAPLGPTARSSEVIIVVPSEWSGFYIGVHGGGAWGPQSVAGDPTAFGDIGAFGNDYEKRGFIAGGHLGYNFEVGSVVFGVQGDMSWANPDGNEPCNDLLTADGTLTRCGSETKWLASATFRLGIASELTLFYIKAGAAVTSVEYRLSDSASSIPQFEAEETRFGWTIGAGIEYRLTQNWSGFIEYDYYDFGTNATNLTSITGPSGSEILDIGERLHVVKGGINYRFGMPAAARPLAARPLVARY